MTVSGGRRNPWWVAFGVVLGSVVAVALGQLIWVVVEVAVEDENWGPLAVLGVIGVACGCGVMAIRWDERNAR